MRYLKTAVLAAAFLGGASAAQALPITVFTQDFETDTAGFSSGALSNQNAQDGTDLTQYHGDFVNSPGTTLTVDLSGFNHTPVSLQFDFYMFGSWDGDANGVGPDFFNLSGDVTFSQTFTNHRPEGDSYDGEADEIFGGGSGATNIYRDLGPTGNDVEFLVNHTADVFTVNFFGAGLSDEDWGIDNVRVSVNAVDAPVPVPAALPLLASAAGLLGFVGWRRKRAA